jgi:uncharacterized protein (TIGR00369 family)
MHERKRTIAWHDPQTHSWDPAAISGLDYLTGIKEGTIQGPPVSHLIGYRICEVRKGFAVFELKPEECHYNPFSTVHGGILSLLLDAAMTASIMSTLPRGTNCSTAEIKVNFIRPAREDSGNLRGEAHAIHTGRRLSTAEGRITDSAGNLYAHGVTTCLLFKVGKPR